MVMRVIKTHQVVGVEAASLCTNLTTRARATNLVLGFDARQEHHCRDDHGAEGGGFHFGKRLVGLLRLWL